MRLLIPFALRPLTCVSSLAQAPGPEWTATATGASEPALRRENPGTTDGTYLYVFGGQSGNSGGVRMNDLWRFDGSVWTQMTADGAAGSPGIASISTSAGGFLC